MVDRVQLPKSHPLEGLDRGKRFYYAHEIDALHAAIIEQGRKVQIAASGESKYGAMSAGEYIEWVAKMLEDGR